ncbi:MAG: hypothetical protein A2622_13590 [Bdellovibrionales bacterium RIFCSPHIGHO2_01_FULL_40_29]|nr:MAG: hypothetical protein A2622_13590 [Bdellovibrionales bacterium RIFCSPHIGHO2_01_FULL_40_29]OFZ34272.1 MAG: hypothetical protein A3D17_04360 [Bdellovibrionales bacterium RIFCSPHIGHO2_02_FULL_40_15]
MQDPPNVVYELNKVDEIITSNSFMFLKKPISKNIQNSDQEIAFKIFVKNVDIKNNVSVNLDDVKFKYLHNSISATCLFNPENSSNTLEATKEYIIDCKVILTQNDVTLIGKNDLIGELRIPVVSKSNKYLSSNVFIRNEELK